MFFFEAMFRKKKEKRRETRIRAADEFMVEFRDLKSQEIILCNGRDFSINGVRFATTASMEKGNMLDITFYFPHKYPKAKKINLKAKVVHIFHPKGTRRDRIGCRLVHEDASTREILNDFLTWIRSRQG